MISPNEKELHRDYYIIPGKVLTSVSFGLKTAIDWPEERSSMGEGFPRSRGKRIVPDFTRDPQGEVRCI